MENVKASLKYAMGLMLAKPPEGVKFSPPSRFLLYGPPGTGKTLLASACARMLGATFFNVKASDLLSKYFGESTKLVSALFARARSEADTGTALVFIDEVDALSGERGGRGESGPERRILSTLLAELDGVSEKGRPSRVITMVATNRPWDIDRAILERFQKHVLVDLPDEPARRAVFAIHTERAGFRLADDVTLDSLAARTKGYSGRLISRVCMEAVDLMVRDMNSDVPKHVEDGSIRGRELGVRPLAKKDFDTALGRHRPDPKEASLDPYKKWEERVGGERA
jgi:SpoVK/Ycf46/Vps4 family AAA+-type ATPase